VKSAAPFEERDFFGRRSRHILLPLEIKMEKLNTEKHELSIDELDAVSGGALYQPLIVFAVATAVRIKVAVEQVVDRLIGH